MVDLVKIRVVTFYIDHSRTADLTRTVFFIVQFVQKTETLKFSIVTFKFNVKAKG